MVYLAGLAQGLALVAFPAASTILTDPKGYGLTSSAYGSLFIPLVICAIATSGASGACARRWGLKPVFLGGLGCDAAAMTLLALSSSFVPAHGDALVTLLLATAALGAGFGATLSALNAYVPGFFPAHRDAALTALHALLGTGTALAPLFVALCARLGAWWLLPLAIAAGTVVLIAVGFGQPLLLEATASGRDGAGQREGGRGMRLWVYGAALVLYGACETLFGNWATIYLHDEVRLAVTWASVALAAFWAMVTVGRVLVAAVAVRHPVRAIYVALPVLMLGSFLGVSRVSGGVGGVLAFAVAGLACSAFFPLSIDFAEAEFRGRAASVSGRLVAAYIVGYGVGAFGVGPLRDAAELSLGRIYGSASVVALGMALLAYRLGPVSGRSQRGAGPA